MFGRSMILILALGLGKVDVSTTKESMCIPQSSADGIWSNKDHRARVWRLRDDLGTAARGERLIDRSHFGLSLKNRFLLSSRSLRAPDPRSPLSIGVTADTP